MSSIAYRAVIQIASLHELWHEDNTELLLVITNHHISMQSWVVGLGSVMQMVVTLDMGLPVRLLDVM